MSNYYDEQFKREVAKEIRELNLKIKELEKENSFLKKPRNSSRKKSISGISVH